MRVLLTGGIKVILAVAALSTAAHWTLRVQRESAIVPITAGLTDPVATGSIAPRRAEPPAALAALPATAVAPAAAAGPPAALRPAAASGPTAGLDQSHLAALIAGAAPAKPKVVRTATKTAAAEKVAAKR